MNDVRLSEHNKGITYLLICLLTFKSGICALVTFNQVQIIRLKSGACASLKPLFHFHCLAELTVFDIYKYQLSLHMYRVVNSNASQNGLWNFQSDQNVFGCMNITLVTKLLDIHQSNTCRALTRQNTSQFQGSKLD